MITKRTSHQILACLPVMFNQFLVGMGWGWTAPTIAKLQSADSGFRMSADEISWIVSISELGRLTSPFVWPLVVNGVGRKNSITLVVILTAFTWLGHIFVRNFYLLCGLRILFGASTVLHDIVTPIYTTENCSPDLRGTIGGILGIVQAVAKCSELVLAAYLSYELTATINTVLSVCAFGGLYFCLETPHFSIMKQKYSEARKTLEWLRADLTPADLNKELDALDEYVRKEKEKSESMGATLSSAENAKSLRVWAAMYFLIATTGGPAIGTYASEIFAPAGILQWTHFLFFAEISNFAAVLVAPLVSFGVNARKFLTACYAAIALGHCASSALFYFHRKANRYMEIYYPWLIFVCVDSYGIVRSLTGPAHSVVRAELLPMSVRALAGSMSIIISAGTGFCVVKAFLPISEYFGIETNFLLYALMGVLMAVLVHRYFPRGPSEESISETEKNLDTVVERTYSVGGRNSV